ncbi:sarcosine oxidase subunit gamma [Litorimonas sp. RW-G-Af-16]|uniref:sarcosine oxidase subunit gamma n=1 Tax=Litorimonas sp. RW-G-Af-16 TaxID=3241168 RepID=UPI00390C4731
MSKLTAKPPLSHVSQSWGSTQLVEHGNGELISLACPLGSETTFATRFKKRFKATPPAPNELINCVGGRAFWTGQGQYMISLDADDILADTRMSDHFGDHGYATLQTDGWTALTLTSSLAYNILERFTPLDLRSAPAMFATRSTAHHMAVIVLKFSDTEFRLLSPRSSAQSFLDALTHTIENTLS